MRFEFKLAWKYLLSRKGRGLLPVVTVITITGVAFGVAALLVTLGIMNGFQQEYERSVLAFNSHILVMNVDSDERVDYVTTTIEETLGEELKGYTPFIFREGLALYGDQVRGLAVKGVDMDRYWELSDMPHQEDATADVPTGVWIGRLLWEEVQQSGSPLRFRLPEGDVGAPQFREIPVIGFFDSGMYDFDSSFALVDRHKAKKDLGIGGPIHGVEIWLQHPRLAQDLSATLRESLKFPYSVLSWQDLNANFFGALKLERLVFSIIMGLLILVASFNIAGTLTMRILDKREDIAILRAMGARWPRLRRLFFLQGLALGWCGCALGALLGYALIYVLTNYQPIGLAEEIYFIDHVPAQWDWVHLGLALLITTVFSWLATRLALLRMGKISVIQALQEA